MRAIFDLPDKQKRLGELNTQALSEDFWADPNKAKGLNQEISQLKETLDRWQSLNAEIAELNGLIELIETEKAVNHDALTKELVERADALEPKIHAEEMKTFLGGPYDQGHAIMNFSSGAGGIDAQDWTGILLNMYRKYAEAHGWQVKLIHESYGEQGGLKDATLKIEGNFAYGFLKNEKGVHRLVRVSPFSAQSLRHTSFALVQVLPELPENVDIKIKPEDLELSTFKSSGAGGQYVNKTESAVRIVHRPTGLSASAQSERSQQQNREFALSLLKAKLLARMEAERKEKIEDLKEKAKPEWGSQIRSYVIHPYKLVKDHRTEVETSDVEGVLNGGLDEFIEASLKKTNG